MFTSSLVLTLQYISDRRSLAAGVTSVGSSLGIMIISLLVEAVIQWKDWQIAVLVEASLVLSGVVCAVIIKPLSDTEYLNNTSTEYKEDYGILKYSSVENDPSNTPQCHLIKYLTTSMLDITNTDVTNNVLTEDVLQSNDDYDSRAMNNHVETQTFSMDEELEETNSTYIDDGYDRTNDMSHLPDHEIDSECNSGENYMPSNEKTSPPDQNIEHKDGNKDMTIIAAANEEASDCEPKGLVSSRVYSWCFRLRCHLNISPLDLSQIWDTSLARKPELYLVGLAVSIFGFTFAGVFTFTQQRLVLKMNADGSERFFILIALCLSNTAGRLVCAILGEVGPSARYITDALSLLTSGVSNILLTTTNSFTMLVIYSIIQGFSLGQ